MELLTGKQIHNELEKHYMFLSILSSQIHCHIGAGAAGTCQWKGELQGPANAHSSSPPLATQNCSCITRVQRVNEQSSTAVGQHPWANTAASIGPEHQHQPNSTSNGYCQPNGTFRIPYSVPPLEGHYWASHWDVVGTSQQDPPTLRRQQDSPYT